MKFAYAIALLAAAGAYQASGTAQAAALAKPVPSSLVAAPLYGARDLGHAAAGRRVDFSVVLPYQHAAELGSLLAAQQLPSSKYYRHFLTAAQFRAYFSPTNAAYAAAANVLRNAGFAVSTFANRTVLHATGTSRNAERFFGTRVDAVREQNGRLAYANVVPATVPATLAGSRVVGVSDGIGARPAVQRGRMVNRVNGDLASPLHERHDASDFEPRTQDQLAPAS